MIEQVEERSLAHRRLEATRKGIVDAAWQICRESGLGSLSLRELGRRVGLKAPSLYAYFDSKSAIYDAMFREGYEQLDAMSAQWEADPATGASARAAFRRGAHEFIEFCTSDPVRYQLMFQRVLPNFEPMPETYAVSVRQLGRLAAVLAGMGVTQPTAMDLWTAMSTGLADQQIANDPGGDRWLRLIDTAVDLFCNHVGIPPEGGTP